MGPQYRQSSGTNKFMSVENTFSGSAVESKGHKPSSGITHRLMHYIHVHRHKHTQQRKYSKKWGE